MLCYSATKEHAENDERGARRLRLLPQGAAHLRVKTDVAAGPVLADGLDRLRAQRVLQDVIHPILPPPGHRSCGSAGREVGTV
jgi:hypothetical protein